MELKPGYTRTEVGVIPNDWIIKDLGEIADVKTGPFGSALHEKDYVDDGTPIITVEHLGERGVVHVNLPRVSETDKKRLNAYILKEGDVVFSRVGSVDRNALIKSNEKGWLFSGRLLRVRINTQTEFPQYLSHHFHTPEFKNRVLSVAVGQTMASLNTKILKGVKVLLPPTKTEQEAIAKTLSDTDAFIESLEQLITKKRRIKQGAMQKLLQPTARDDVKRLGDISLLKGRIGWQGLKQTEFTNNADEPFLITGMNFKDGAIRWEEVYHISEERYDIAKDIQLKRDDVLMTKDGTIGKVLYVDHIPNPNKATLNSHLLLFRPIQDSYHPKYLYYQLNSKRFKDFVEMNKSGTTFFGLSQGAVSNYPFLSPPLDEQKKIAVILSDMDNEITALETKLAKTRQIKQGMMAELLTGSIRLVETKPAEHKWAFKEAVIIAALADKFGSTDFPLGRKRCTKLTYLLHRRAEGETQGYLKKAAGPYNPKTRYAGPESIAQKSRYIKEHRNGKYKGFIAAEQIEQARDYFDQWYGDEMLDWLERFRFKPNDELECIATVDMAMQDLIKDDKEPSLYLVCQLIAAESEWRPKLKRASFSDENILSAIETSRELFNSTP